MEDVTYELGSVVSPDLPEQINIGSQADEVLACTAGDELGRYDVYTDTSVFIHSWAIYDCFDSPPLEFLYLALSLRVTGSIVQIED